MTSAWLIGGGSVSYNAHARHPENVRTQLTRRGLNTEDLERNDRLRIWDWYTATLGKQSKEKYFVPSLKAAELSIFFAKEQIPGPPVYDRLRISDNGSVMARFNDEKSWVEFLLTRGFPLSPIRKLTSIYPVARGLHSEWAYKQLEGTADGIIDFKVEEVEGELKSLMRIRVMRDVGFDSRWHQLEIGENFEVRLEK
jgi:KaiC/GvpD/RAD55 family RecA-like ATPase